MRRLTLEVDIDIDFKFFALLPALNINIHSKQLEFEWLCLGVYVGKKQQETAQPQEIITAGLFQFYSGKLK